MIANNFLFLMSNEAQSRRRPKFLLWLATDDTHTQVDSYSRCTQYLGNTKVLTFVVKVINFHFN